MVSVDSEVSEDLALPPPLLPQPSPHHDLPPPLLPQVVQQVMYLTIITSEIKPNVDSLSFSTVVGRQLIFR